MSNNDEPFGAQLYAELRKMSGYNVVTSLLDYNAIQKLKQADRDTTVSLFSRSSYELLQQIRKMEPPELAHYLVEKSKVPADDGNAYFIMLAALNLL